VRLVFHVFYSKVQMFRVYSLLNKAVVKSVHVKMGLQPVSELSVDVEPRYVGTSSR